MTRQTEVPATVETLRARVAAPTWVGVAGYGLEALHAGVLARALQQQHFPRRQLIAALWQQATGELLDPETIIDDGISVRRDDRLFEGNDGAIDLLIGFDVGEERWRLGIDLSVDSLPRPERGPRLLAGLESRGGARNALAFAALGMSQVSQTAAPEGEWASWQLETLLELAPALRLAARADHIVEPWIAELETEQLRRRVAAQVRADEAESLGYRGRSLLAYQLGSLCAQLREETGAPWQIAFKPNGISARADSLARYKLTPRQKIWFNLEVSDSDLSLKAWTDQKVADLQGDTSSIASSACRIFWAHGLLAAPPTHPRPGTVSTLLTVPLRASSPGSVGTLVRASRAWQAVAISLSLRGQS